MRLESATRNWRSARSLSSTAAAAGFAAFVAASNSLAAERPARNGAKFSLLPCVCVYVRTCVNV